MGTGVGKGAPVAFQQALPVPPSCKAVELDINLGNLP